MTPLVIIAGPTAVGKSDIAVKLAKKINGSIISADSMQVYKGMDIGSAKITPDEMQGVKHYLIDVLDPHEDFNVALFKSMTEKAYADILSEGKIPIIAGGTGFYIQSFLYDINFNESVGELSDYRKELEALYEEKGADFLYDMLKEKDPVSAGIIHKNNVKRVIRALEFYKETGRPISEHNELEHEKPSAYNSAFFVLTDERSRLYEKIDRRVDLMLENGLIEEVKGLRDMGLKKTDISMQGLGYKEILSYLEGECSLEDAVYLIKRDSRHFAKRQITWFKREKNVLWINKPDFDYDDERILDYMYSECLLREIIKS